jgi:uncharacterized protein
MASIEASASALPVSPVLPAAPVALERIAVLDVLRGIALLGMFVVHFNYYESTPIGAEPGPAAAFVERVIGLFFESRFHAIFGMLFGVGFAVQLARADARGEHFVARYLRRLFALAVFGFIAEGIFGYNVLFGYAMWGLPLLLVRRWPIRALVVILVLCAAARPLYNLTRIAIYSSRPDGMAQFAAANQQTMSRFTAAREKADSAERAADWGTVIAARVEFMPRFHRQWSFLPSGSFTLFLLGMIAFRLGLFDRPERHRRLIVSLMIGGAASWAFALWVLPIGGPAPAAPPQEGAVLHAVVTMARLNAFMLLREQWLAFAYVGAILLLVAHAPVWLSRLSPLAWAGRMALTNYMTQVILLDVLFTPHGFGFTVPAPMVFMGAVLLFAAQAMVSRWWLTRFTLGPLEWVWRWFTHWKRPALRREVPGAAPVVAPA